MNIFSFLAGNAIAKIPIIIPAFNNPTYVRNMLAQLSSHGLRNSIVFDNCSTARGMRRSFRRARNVVRLSDNYGPRHVFSEARIFDALPSLFCITDPDIQFNPRLPRNFLNDLVGLTEQYQIGKVGFCLDISDRTNMRDDDIVQGDGDGQRLCKIWEWEQQYWTDQIGVTVLGDPIYRAFIDTTFAVYNKKYFKRERFLDALRVGGRYAARHLPWYADCGMPKDEAVYYAATQKYSHYLPVVPGGG